MSSSIGRYVTLVLVAACLGGCASPKVTVAEFRGPSGRTGYVLGCGAAGPCYQRAGELCANGYEIVDRATSHVAFQGMMAPRTTLTVECK